MKCMLHRPVFGPTTFRMVGGHTSSEPYNGRDIKQIRSLWYTNIEIIKLGDYVSKSIYISSDSILTPIIESIQIKQRADQC